MGHAPATIVILAWNEWEHTRACLESLRPTLGPRDQVVVVDNGSVDGTAEGLRRYRWAEVVTNPENRGFAGGCNQGAERARNDVVVFLNNDTLLPSRWLDGLLAPFDDPTVVATGPRSNFVSGPQLVQGASYDVSRTADLQRFARTWRDEHRGEVTEVTRLVGFCLAVRRPAFEQIGGFDEGFGLGGYEDDDLCTRLLGTGGRLVIAHESFVHHDGHVSFDGNGVDWSAVEHVNRVRYEDKHKRGIDPDAGVLLSACMIVKDEEALLAECLDSLAGVVDEIVVYDTGSSDRTVEIAEAAGATVLRGYWDDDFGRARNAALDACSGQWILHIDADERLEGDSSGLRPALSTASADQFNVRLDNLAPDGVGIGFSHHATRLFRRARGHWLGRLHEQIVPRQGQPALRAESLDAPHLLHVGYRADIVEDRDKLARNLRVAEAEVAGGAAHPAHAVLSLGRALSAAGKTEEALARFVEARDMSAHEPGVRRQALRNGAQTLLDLGRPEEALAWIEALRASPGSGGMAAFLHGLALLNLGDHAAALEAMSGIDEGLADHDGYTIPPSALTVNRGLCLLGEQRWAEAAQTLRPLLNDADVKVPVWAVVVDATAWSGGDVRELAGLVEVEQLTAVLGQLLNAEHAPAEAVADALWQRLPGSPALLAFATRVAPAAGLERAMEWSARLRAANVHGHCPVVALARDESQEPVSRVRAAAVAAAGFGDAGGRHLLGELGVQVPLGQLADSLLQVATLAPELLPLFIESSAVGPQRCLVLAQSLHELGAPDEALAVFEHGFAQPGPPASVVDEAAAWLRELGHDRRATELVQAC